MRVALLGAGIGGLALAGGLVRAGIEVTVYERSAELSTGGFGLSLFPNGLHALDLLGSGPEVRALASSELPSLPGGIRDQHGRWLTRLDAEAVEHTLAEALVVERHRLHEVLARTCGDRIRFSVAVDTVTDDAVEFADGTRESGFDLVIGADGIRSTVRRGWPGNTAAHFAGYHAWRGMTWRPVELDGIGEIWGPGRRFGIAPLPDGRVYWFATANGNAADPPAGTPETVRAAFAGWHRDITRVLDSATAEETHSLPIEELRPDLKAFVHGRRVLIGDAAHAMTPNLGQGANQALEDAAQLIRCLTLVADQPRISASAFDSVLGRYDRSRRRRAQRIAYRSRALGRIGQWTDPAAVGARSLAFRLTPPHLARATAMRMLRWDVR